MHYKKHFTFAIFQMHFGILTCHPVVFITKPGNIRCFEINPNVRLAWNTGNIIGLGYIFHDNVWINLVIT